MQINASNPRQLVKSTNINKPEKVVSQQLGAPAGSVLTRPETPSIAKLNAAITQLERSPEFDAGLANALREQRNMAIAQYTGATDISAYDKNLVARAQSNGISYNAMVDEYNAQLTMASQYRPDTDQSPLRFRQVERVENLPWETPRINARVDELILRQGLSLNAAIVIAMTERQTQYSSITEQGVPTGVVRIDRPSIQGDWQAGFADQVMRAGDELTGWASSQTDQTGTATVSLSSAGDIVKVSQRDDGKLLVEFENDPSRNQVIDPSGKDRIFIIGGDGADRITIDPSVTANMFIAGGDGDDKIFGGRGNDVLVGGNGDDLIRGNSGTDIIVGGDGADNIEGGNGGDIVLGGKGADYVSGGNGNDVVLGGLGRDSLYGGRGEDMLFGQGGNDNINGGSGADYLQGGRGNDAIIGGKGDDKLLGGTGADTLIGATGDDTYTDAGAGDRVIKEGNETANKLASIDVVEIDPTLGKVDELVVDGNRDEFVTRVDDDLELLRSTRSGQEMLTGLAEISARTGNVTEITEIDATNKSAVTEDGEQHFPSENALAWSPDSPEIEYGDTPSSGADSMIYYNTSVNTPLIEADGLQAVPPVIALFHELSHAFNQTGGTLLVNHQPHFDEVGDAERQAVGLPIYVDVDGDGRKEEIIVDQPTENNLRKELGIGDRVQY